MIAKRRCRPAWCRKCFFRNIKDLVQNYVEYKCLHSEISHIGQALISAKITLETIQKSWETKAGQTASPVKKSRGIHECDQNIPELLVSIKALTTIGGLCLAKSQCERLS